MTRQWSGNRTKAKRIILEIINQSGGALYGATNLHKAFYYAHLWFLRNNEDEDLQLSDWPIAKLTHGPGIHDWKNLWDELVDEGCLLLHNSGGEYERHVFQLGDNGIDCELNDEEVEVIREAVDKVRDQFAKKLSEKTHEESNAWRSENMGARLNLHNDLLSPDKFNNSKAIMEEVKENLPDIFKM